MSVDPTPAGSRRDSKITIKYVSPYAELMPIVWLADHTVVFTHIPKAAGSTLDSILKDIAEDDGLKWLRVMGTLYGQFLGPGKPDTLAELRGLSNEALSRAQFLTGHLPFGVHERIEGKCFYITVLREPVSRLVSHFRYGVERGGWPAATAIEDLLRDGLLIDNPQTRQLAGLRDAGAKCTPATLETALSNLESHYGIVGVTERFDEVLKALIGLYGWPDLAYTDGQVTTARIGGELEMKVAEAARRMDEDRFPVCSPALLERGPPLERPEDLRYHTLLHDDHVVDWRMWLLAAGVSGIDTARGPMLNFSDLVLQSAAAGHGVALARSVLAARYLASGELVRPFEFSLPGKYAYYVVSAAAKANQPKVRKFREWILEVSREDAVHEAAVVDALRADPATPRDGGK